LRRVTLDDAPALQALASDGRVAEMTSAIPHPYPPDGAATFIRSLEQAASVDLVIERKEEQTVIGMISLRPLDGWAVAELGYYIGVPYWHQGYATEAVRRLVDYGFAGLDVRRYVNHVFAGNLASARVLEKTGHVRIGEAEHDYPLRGGKRYVWYFELKRPDAS
jgi:RimJ/RimL family protein N-acetyltransferase